MAESFNNQNKQSLDSQIPTQLGLNQMEEIFQEYQQNKQNITEEFMRGLSEVFNEIGKLSEDIGKGLIREEKRKENLSEIRNGCCKISKELYDTIKFNFNMSFCKKN